MKKTMVSYLFFSQYWFLSNDYHFILSFILSSVGNSNKSQENSSSFVFGYHLINYSIYTKLNEEYLWWVILLFHFIISNLSQFYHHAAFHVQPVIKMHSFHSMCHQVRSGYRLTINGADRLWNRYTCHNTKNQLPEITSFTRKQGQDSSILRNYQIWFNKSPHRYKWVCK